MVRAPVAKAAVVGHSMGGLVSRLQSVDSRDDFWKTPMRSSVFAGLMFGKVRFRRFVS